MCLTSAFTEAARSPGAGAFLLHQREKKKKKKKKRKVQVAMGQGHFFPPL